MIIFILKSSAWMKGLTIFSMTGTGSTYQTELLSYAVDDKGNITLPFIGSIMVKDLTINQAKEKIEKSLAQLP